MTNVLGVFKQGISLPTDGVACNVAGDDAGDVVGTIPTLECADRGVKMKKSNKINMERIQTSRTRYCNDKIFYNFIYQLSYLIWIGINCQAVLYNKLQLMIGTWKTNVQK